MGYYEQSQLSADMDFYSRIAACAAVEVADANPQMWAQNNIWHIAASPGFADAYSYALNTGVENPGRDPAVITDEMILSAVQAHIPATSVP
jgi:hypothetical protein